MDSEITDLGPLCEPKSDQLNADDLVSGPRVFTVAKIKAGPKAKRGEQPVHIYLAEFDRGPWKPPVSVRRVMLELWGRNPAMWPAGARVELWRDPEVSMGDDPVGGVRVCGMSHIDAPEVTVLLTIGRGKRITVRVHRLDTAPPDLTAVLAAAGLTEADLDRWRGDKPAASTLTTDQRGKLAQWLTPDRLATIPRQE